MIFHSQTGCVFLPGHPTCIRGFCGQASRRASATYASLTKGCRSTMSQYRSLRARRHVPPLFGPFMGALLEQCPSRDRDVLLVCFYICRMIDSLNSTEELSCLSFDPSKVEHVLPKAGCLRGPCSTCYTRVEDEDDVRIQPEWTMEIYTATESRMHNRLCLQ